MRPWLFAMALCLATGSVLGEYIVSPNSRSDSEGSTNNGYPLNLSGDHTHPDGMRYQQVYAAGQFASAEQTPLLIGGLAFRPDMYAGQSFSATLLSGVQVRLSTTVKSVDGLSVDLDQNIGGDERVVFDGNLSLSSACTGVGPRDFDITITFDQPFLYNPSVGNLLLEISNLSDAATTFFDAHASNSDGTSRAFMPATTHNPYALTDSTGLVTRFHLVPEPQTVGLLLLGLAMLRRRGLR